VTATRTSPANFAIETGLYGDTEMKAGIEPAGSRLCAKLPTRTHRPPPPPMLGREATAFNLPKADYFAI